jgi:hypothetical protein
MIAQGEKVAWTIRLLSSFLSLLQYVAGAGKSTLEYSYLLVLAAGFVAKMAGLGHANKTVA